MIWFQMKRSRLCPKEEEDFVSSDKHVDSHWREMIWLWFGESLKEDKATYAAVQIMHWEYLEKSIEST